MRSIAGKGAVLVSPDSIEQIAEGMRLVLAENEESCQQRLRIGFLHVQKYSSEIMIDSYQQMYKRLMGEIS
jgi:trehalose-6-phosphate synthase